MVRPENDYGIVGQTFFPESAEMRSEPFVHLTQSVVILSPVIPDRGHIRMIGRNGCLGRIMLRFAVARSDLAFVGAGLVENCEEGLSLFALVVVRFTRGLVPDVPDVVLNVVVGL